MHAAPQPRPAEFASTGPHGHRARMRGRLLARGTALADYEILEMLLFLGIPRRDTKPQAKGLINRFGGLAGTLTAGSAALSEAGLPPRAAAVMDLVVDAAAQLAQAERRSRVRLGDREELDRYLSRRAMPRPPGVAALLLNNRNQLLTECACAGDDAGSIASAMLRQALSHDATAVILLRTGGTARLGPTDRALFACCLDAAAPLSIVLHDLVGLGNEPGWSSLRSPGR